MYLFSNPPNPIYVVHIFMGLGHPLGCDWPTKATPFKKTDLVLFSSSIRTIGVIHYGCGWPTKANSPSLRSCQLSIAPPIGVGVCETPPPILECWWALPPAVPCADKCRCCEVLKQGFCQGPKTLFCSVPPSPLTHYPSAPSFITVLRGWSDTVVPICGWTILW